MLILVLALASRIPAFIEAYFPLLSLFPLH